MAAYFLIMKAKPISSLIIKSRRKLLKHNMLYTIYTNHSENVHFPRHLFSVHCYCKGLPDCGMTQELNCEICWAKSTEGGGGGGGDGVREST